MKSNRTRPLPFATNPKMQTARAELHKAQKRFADATLLLMEARAFGGSVADAERELSDARAACSAAESHVEGVHMILDDEEIRQRMSADEFEMRGLAS